MEIKKGCICPGRGPIGEPGTSPQFGTESERNAERNCHSVVDFTAANLISYLNDIALIQKTVYQS